MGFTNVSGLSSALRQPCVRGRILVIDDDADVVQLLAVRLRFVGFQVETATDGNEALSRARERRPDAVLLEVTMPGMDGFAVLDRLRAAGVWVPVLFVTRCDSMDVKIRGLGAGADDYITKPFHLEEVVARLTAVLRRTNAVAAEDDIQADRITYADLVLDETSHEVWKAEVPIPLSPLEFELLRYFMVNAETVLSKRMILGHVRPEHPDASVNFVESYVSHLRRKVERGEKPLLHTMRGLGYVLRDNRRTRRHDHGIQKVR